MTAYPAEITQKNTKPVLKVTTYLAAYVISCLASLFCAAIVTVAVYQLTYFKTLNDKISFYTFLAAFPLLFILLAWLAVPRMVRLMLKDIRSFI